MGHGPAPNKTRRVSDATYTPTSIRPRNNSLSPYDNNEKSNIEKEHRNGTPCASPIKTRRKVGWSPAPPRKVPSTETIAGVAASDNEDDENCDSPFAELSTDKLTAMRKSLRSRSIAGQGSTGQVAAGTPTTPTMQTGTGSGTGFSLMSGLKGVNNFVTVTGTHISGRRLSTPSALGTVLCF